MDRCTYVWDFSTSLFVKVQNPMFNMLNAQMSTHDVFLSSCQQSPKSFVYCKAAGGTQSNLYVGSWISYSYKLYSSSKVSVQLSLIMETALFFFLSDFVICFFLCMWDFCRQKENYSACKSVQKICTFLDSVLFGRVMNISVSAQNVYGYTAHSKEVTYSNVWNIGKLLKLSVQWFNNFLFPKK